MLKSELIEKIANKLMDLPVHEIAAQVNKIIEIMDQALINKERIEIRGFGSFTIHYRPPHKAHNPKTRAYVISAAKFRPHFKPGKALRERVNLSRSG